MKRQVVVTAVAGVLMLGLAAVAGAADPKGEFVGSEKCKGCHSEEYKSWKDSWHSKMVRPKKDRHSQGGRGEVGQRWYQ